MSIQTRLVQCLLYFNMAGVTILLQPYFPKLKHALIQRYHYGMSFRPLCHTIYVCYCMVLLMFADSVMRIHKASNLALHYQAERNFYLCGLTLFLALIFRKTCDVLAHTLKTEETNKYTLRQHGNSMVFVNKVIDEAKTAKARIEQLEAEIASLKQCVEGNETAMAEIEHNKKAYLNLKDKYEKLKAIKIGESKKSK